MKSAARRQLFGPADSVKVHEDFLNTQMEASRRFREEWNYDVGSDRPLEGDYEWTVVDPASTPQFYLKTYPRVCLKRPRSPDSDLPFTSCKVRRLVFSDDDYSDVTPSSENDSVSDPCSTSSSPSFSSSTSASPITASDVERTPSSRLRQTRISEYMQLRKKLSSHKLRRS